jgi:hypothetical protein
LTKQRNRENLKSNGHNLRFKWPSTKLIREYYLIAANKEQHHGVYNISSATTESSSCLDEFW